MKKILIFCAMLAVACVSIAQIPCPCDAASEYGSGPMGTISPGDSLTLTPGNGLVHDSSIYCGSETSDHAIFVPWSGQVQMFYDQPITVNWIDKHCTGHIEGPKCATVYPGSIEWNQTGGVVVWISITSTTKIGIHQSGSGGSLPPSQTTLQPPGCN